MRKCNRGIGINNLFCKNIKITVHFSEIFFLFSINFNKI